jgi:pimeloyl-ACP methyl ester carboxylesterase
MRGANHPDGHDIALYEKEWESMRRDLPRWLADNADGFYLPESTGITPEFTQWTIGLILQTSLTAALACDRHKVLTDLRPDLRQVSVPTLLIQGDRDVSEPVENSRYAAGLIPHCRYKEYAGAPHGIIYTHLDRLNDDILSFIQDSSR